MNTRHRSRWGARRHRLFFALSPDMAATGAIARLTAQVRAAHVIAEPAVPAARLHVSLAFVRGGEAPPQAALVAEALAAARGLDITPFRLAFNRLASWPRPTGLAPLVLVGDEGVIGVERLHEALQARLAGAGLVPADERARVVHLTLLWGRHALDQWLREPISWTVREVLLVDSILGEGRHVVLGRVALRPALLPAPPAARPGLPRSAAR